MFGDGFFAGVTGAIKNAIIGNVGNVIVKALGFMGIGLAVHELIIEPLINHVVAGFSAIPPELASWMHLLGLDVAVSIIISAISIAYGSKVFVRKK